MLLHKSNINVAIANILPYSKSRYDLPRPKYKNLGSRETEKWARLILRGPPIELGLKLFFGESRPPVGRLDTQISLPLSIPRLSQKFHGLYLNLIFRVPNAKDCNNCAF